MSKRTIISDNLKEFFADGGALYESPLMEEGMMAGEEELAEGEGGDELEMQIQDAIAFLTEQGFEVTPA